MAFKVVSCMAKAKPPLFFYLFMTLSEKKTMAIGVL